LKQTSVTRLIAGLPGAAGVDETTRLCLVIGMGSLLIPDSSGQTTVTWELLPHVSRTFALTIPVLDEPLRSEVAVAYLLCRIADTIEDAEGIPPATRRALFETFIELIDHPLEPEPETRFRNTWCGQVDAYHQELIHRSGDVLAIYARFNASVQVAISNCLHEMIEGMLTFLERSQTNEGLLRPCSTVLDLERYCHVVAGTVGILLTDLFARELGTAWATPACYEDGRRFGLGLQITNVLKDAEGDRRRGVTYLPDTPHALVPLAVSHLDRAHHYALSIPRARPDMRLFCVWACHLALATLARIAHDEPGKVPRSELTALLEQSRRSVLADGALEERHHQLRNRVMSI
jgi:4,4'-diapophytoene synthase